MKKIIIILSILFYIDVNASTSSITKYYKTTMNNGIYLTKEISAYDYINVPKFELINNEVNTKYKKMRGAYAHAIVDTPLAQSKKYTLGSGGIGNLIIFNSSVASHYESSSADGIQMAYNGDQTI